MTPEVSAGSTPVVRNDDVILRTDVSNIAKLQNIECKIPKIKYRSEHRKNSILTLQTSKKHRKYTAKNSDFSTKIWDFWNVCIRIPFSEALSLTSSTTLYNNVFSAVQTNNLEFQTTDLTRVCNSKHNKSEKILNFYSPALKKSIKTLCLKKVLALTDLGVKSWLPLSFS